jgi:hypothetical protein
VVSGGGCKLTTSANGVNANGEDAGLRFVADDVYCEDGGPRQGQGIHEAFRQGLGR